MNSKTAKMLRRVARHSTVDWKDVRYETVNGTVKVQRGCAEAYLRELKRLNRWAVPGTPVDFLNRAPHAITSEEKLALERWKAYVARHPQMSPRDKLSEKINDDLLR